MPNDSVVIIDYGSGNLRSAAKAFERVIADNALNLDVIVSNDPAQLNKATRIVLPGQGAFGDCMNGLSSIPGMIEALGENVIKKAKPFFGICVGMQLMATRGLEHGEHQGLNWIPGDVVKMQPSDPKLKIPHMGWNGLTVAQPQHFVLQGITKNSNNTLPDFYFVHSFVFECKDSKNIAAWCDYGGKFAAIVAQDNMIGCQFHPEKSQGAGLDLIRGFLRWNP